jgi:hypothetical protein
MTKSRDKRRRTAFVAAAGAAAAVVVAVVLLAGTSATGSTPGGDLAEISNEGQPVDPDPGMRQELANVGAIAVSRLAARDHRTFFRLMRPDGGICYTVNSTGEPDRLGNTSCPTVPASFPSPRLPVLDLSVFESTSHVIGETRLVAAQGFAADGVATVALLDRGGRIVAHARAADNVYALDVPQDREATTVAVYDRRHAEIFRLP